MSPKSHDWEKLSHIAAVVTATVAVIQVSFVITSLLLIWSQLRQQVKLAKAANTQAAVSQVVPLNLQLVQNPEVDKIWLKGVKDETMDAVEQDRYQTLIDTFLIFYENLYWQHKSGLLDDNIYVAWDNDFKYFIKQTHLEKFWSKKRDAYHPEFAAHVDDLIRQNQAAQNP